MDVNAQAPVATKSQLRVLATTSPQAHDQPLLDVTSWFENAPRERILDLVGGHWAASAIAGTAGQLLTELLAEAGIQADASRTVPPDLHLHVVSTTALAWLRANRGDVWVDAFLLTNDASVRQYARGRWTWVHHPGLVTFKPDAGAQQIGFFTRISAVLDLEAALKQHARQQAEANSF